MKKILLIAGCLLMLASCKETTSTGNFGATITEEGAVSVADMVTQMGDKEEWTGKITAPVSEVCQTEGCWYTVKLPSGEDMLIMTKDHDYTLPKDCSGKTAVAEGKAYWKTVSVESQKHIAEDAKKTPEEIAAITEPKKELRFEAAGVIIK